MAIPLPVGLIAQHQQDVQILAVFGQETFRTPEVDLEPGPWDHFSLTFSCLFFLYV